MNTAILSDKSTFIFDAFGTLFQTAPLDQEFEKLAGHQGQELIATWRRKQLEYSWLRSQMDQYTPFSSVTRDALQYAMDALGIVNEKLVQYLLSIFDHPSLIPGGFDLLSFLKEQNKNVGILSNGTMKMLNNGIRKTKIDHLVDHVFSVDSIRIYKPDPRVYQMALDKLTIDKKEVFFLSSNQWDIAGASTFGLDCVWINQYDETKEVLPFGKVLEVNGLQEVQKLMD